MPRNRYVASTTQLAFSCGLQSRGLTLPLQGGEFGRVWLSVAFEGPNSRAGRDFALELLDRKLAKIEGTPNWCELEQGLASGEYSLEATSTGLRNGFTVWRSVAGVIPLWLAAWIFGMLPLVRDQTQASAVVSSSNPQFHGVTVSPTQ